ncbi:MAG: methyltransferase domain-containing protein [Clostridia bacterium]|nr:methyltransferase domain-containing protein [Clostridia bacterium]
MVSERYTFRVYLFWRPKKSRHDSNFRQKLVEYAEIESGSIVLDVAFGRGTSLFPAAESTCINGQVVGIDFSHEMVDQTSKFIKENEIHKIELKVKQKIFYYKDEAEW